jgi:undecaprenyl-diphosphatase
MVANAGAFLALLVRPPRLPQGAFFAWRSTVVLAGAAALTAIAIAAAMLLLDPRTFSAMLALPGWIISVAAIVTDLGRSGWFLAPIALALLLLSALASPRLSRFTDGMMAALAVRLGFLFSAITLPSLFDSILKRLIGRARPFVGGHGDPFNFTPFAWRPDHASLPSGHATTAFAALVAIGLIWPRLRGIMAAYAIAIAASRVILLAHFPSDVIAGAALGAAGALVVRDWFAARRLGFAVGAGGRVRALPGPSWARIKRVARQVAAS